MCIRDSSRVFTWTVFLVCCVFTAEGKYNYLELRYIDIGTLITTPWLSRTVAFPGVVDGRKLHFFCAGVRHWHRHCVVSFFCFSCNKCVNIVSYTVNLVSRNRPTPHTEIYSSLSLLSPCRESSCDIAHWFTWFDEA